MNPADEARMAAWGERHKIHLAQHRARLAREAREALERFEALSPQERFFAACDATMARLNRPCVPAIDPEGDVDNPGETGWHGRKW